ncbi:hypothetical protein ElyMa_005636500 [Elysia marginata]|uniref:PiggyBac transposable element-derived protein domain-containing protein n=1 Tax=Elysia marginata TaxID=1093978 RepID=A0AAV4F8C5_9GAST|nr:hypothetical protein ElyMa_005636500 [Elysia marginata]
MRPRSRTKVEKKTSEAATVLKTETLDHNNEDPEITGKEQEKRSRKRKITWFIPLNNNSIAINIVKTFFTLIDTYFPPDHKLHKIINKKYTFKRSYSCMNNVKQIRNNHNNSMITKHNEEKVKKKLCDYGKKTTALPKANVS